MGWADFYIKSLKEGKTVKFRPKGNSMTPKIKSGELCTVEPATEVNTLPVGTIVLCQVRHAQYLHLISGHKPGQVQISNNHGKVNGWISYSNVYGVLTLVEP